MKELPHDLRIRFEAFYTAYEQARETMLAKDVQGAGIDEEYKMCITVHSVNGGRLFEGQQNRQHC